MFQKRSFCPSTKLVGGNEERDEKKRARRKKVKREKESVGDQLEGTVERRDAKPQKEKQSNEM